MPYLSKRQAGAFLFHSIMKGPDDLLDLREHARQCGDYSFTSQLLPLAKEYVEGRVDLCAIRGDACRSALLSVPSGKGPTKAARDIESIGKENVRCRRINVPQVHALELNDLNGGDYRSMLVDVAKSVDGIEVLIPAKVSLGILDYADDLWSGEVYLSIREGRYKSGRFTVERVLDTAHRILVGDVNMRCNDLPDQMIKGAPQIVESLSNQNGEVVLDGFVAYDGGGSLTGLFVVLDDDLAVSPQELRDTPLEIVDVMFGSP